MCYQPRFMRSELLLALALGYLLGSIPFGLVLTRLAGKGDVRDALARVRPEEEEVAGMDRVGRDGDATADL